MNQLRKDINLLKKEVKDLNIDPELKHDWALGMALLLTGDFQDVHEIFEEFTNMLRNQGYTEKDILVVEKLGKETLQLKMNQMGD